MAATRIQTITGNGGGYNNTCAVTFSSNVTAGSLIVVAICVGLSASYDVISVTDSQGRTYTKIQEGESIGTEGEMWYTANASAGATTITATITAANFADMCMIAREYGGLTTTPLDVSAENIEGSYLNSHSVGTTGTTTQANELVVAMYCGDANATYTVGAGYGNLAQHNGSDLYQSIALQDKDVASTGTQTASFDSGATYMQGYGMIATFKVAAGAPLINAVSGTNAGFSGSPDNTDPFTSAQAVTYTVQSALAPGTYYWRVRAIDPSGTNTYGAWAATQSFTITASGTPPGSTFMMMGV